MNEILRSNQANSLKENQIITGKITTSAKKETKHLNQTPVNLYGKIIEHGILA